MNLIMAEQPKLQNKEPAQEALQIEENYGSVERSTGTRFLHLYLEESMNIETGSTTGVVDLIFEINAYGKKKYTRVVKGVSKASQTYWGQHFFMEKEFSSQYEVDSETIEIKAYNHRSLGLDSFIGSCSISQEQVYSSDDHTIRYNWLPLSNIEKNHESIYGFLKISINISRPGDKRILLDDEPKSKRSTGDDKGMGAIMLPPQIKMKKQQITIKIIKAEGIVKMDEYGAGKADPYISFKLGGLKSKTSVKTSTLEPTWNEKILIPTCNPTIDDRLFMILKDYDSLGTNEVIGSYVINYSEISNNSFCKPFWVNFYGAWSKTGDPKMKKLMNQIGDLGSRFKGRALMQITLEDCDDPKYGVYSLQQSEYFSAPEKQSFEAWVDVSYVCNLNSTPTNHKVVVSWGGKSVETAPKKYNRGVLLYFERLKIVSEFSVYKMTELPDIIVSVYDVDTDKHISYKRFSTLELFDLGSKAKNVFMEVDKSVSPKMRFDQSGVLKARFGISPTGGWDSMAATYNWVEEPCFKKELFNRCTIIANIFQAKNLVAGDSTGLSDPMTNLYHFGTSRSSNIFPKTLNPSWNQRLVLGTWTVNGEMPPLIISVYDYDSTLIGDAEYDFLGSSILNFEAKDFTQDPGLIPHPVWIDLKQDKNSVMGKLLISYTVLPIEVEIPRSLSTSIIVKRRKHFLKIKILGLRNLESLGIIPVCRPSIRINLNSLKILDEAKAESSMSDIITEPREAGSNPNIGTVLNLELELPEDMKLMPILSCNVLDSFMGKRAALGNFEIDIGYFNLLAKARMIMKLKRVRLLLQQQHNLTLLEKVTSVIDKFMTDIEFNKTDMKIEDIADDTPGEEEDSLDITSIGKAFSTNANKTPSSIKDAELTLGDFKGEDDEDDLEAAPESAGALTDLLTGITAANKTSEHEVMDLDDKEDILNVVQGHFRKLRPKECRADNTDDEDDLSIDLEFENKQPIVKVSEMIIHKLIPKSLNMTDPDSSTINLKQDEDDDDNYLMTEEEVTMQQANKIRSLPKGVKIHDSGNFVMLPKYVKKQAGTKFVRREIEIPDQEQFICLGYDSKTRKSKHYRYVLGTELEKTHYMGARSFKSLPITRGKQAKAEESFFSRMLPCFKDEVFKQVGTFKGVVDIISEEDLDLLRGLNLEREGINIHVPTSVQSWKQVSNLDLDLMRKNEVVIRVYIVDAKLYESNDLLSESDPYLRIQLGDRVINDRANSIDNQNNPQFLKMFELKSTFPGQSHLKVQVWDEDSIKSDELIGETTIDIENRFYDERYRSLKNFPIETRKLYHPKSRLEKGIVNMWVEIFSARNKEQDAKTVVGNTTKYNKIWEISPRPSSEIELRVIVWDVDGVPMADTEDTVDIYVSGALPAIKDSHESRTDVHFRSQTGFGSFNWRMKFPILVDQYMKKEQMRLSLKIWDKDIFKSNEFLSEATLDISEIVFDTVESETGNKMYSNEGKDLKLVLPTVANTTRGVIGKTGTITVSVEVVTKDEAERSPVGQGRSDPNQDPFLPNPTGRFEWTMNPWKLFTQTVGPKFRRKLALYCCGICCALWCLLFITLFMVSSMTRIF